MHLCIPGTGVCWATGQKMLNPEERASNIVLCREAQTLESNTEDYNASSSIGMSLGRPKCNARKEICTSARVGINVCRCVIAHPVCKQTQRHAGKWRKSLDFARRSLLQIVTISNVIHDQSGSRQPQCESLQSELKVAKGHPFCSACRHGAG